MGGYKESCSRKLSCLDCQVMSNAAAARAKVDDLAAQHAQLEGRATETAARCDELCTQGDALGKGIAAATDKKHQVIVLPEMDNIGGHLCSQTGGAGPGSWLRRQAVCIG